MINLIGNEFHGQAHCGIDDAKNIANIVIRLIKDGALLILNQKLDTAVPPVFNSTRSAFAVPVYLGEWKFIRGTLRPNYPAKLTPPANPAKKR